MTSLLRHTTLIALVYLLSLIAPSPLQAQAPDRREALVYATTYFDGSAYGSTFAPPETETIYLIAGRENVIAPRRTLVYYWPLSNKLLADWDELNELVEGTLEIRRGDTLVHTAVMTSFVVQYDEADPFNSLALYAGEQAVERYETYQRAQEQYRRTQYDAYQAYLDWREARDLLLAQAEPGTITSDDIPPPPAQPRPITLNSTEPRQGYVVSLPAGTYRLQVRTADGALVPNSSKTLVVFERLRSAVSYDVVPQQRWTRHETSDDPDSVIYALPDTSAYLRSYRQSEYSEFFYRRLREPQEAVSRSERTMWVRHDALYAPTLVIRQGNRTVQEIPREGYHVQQLPGSRLGYEVVPFDPETMESFTFEGYRIAYDFAEPSYTIELRDEDGRAISGSQRQIRALHTTRALPLYLLSGLPLVAGLALYLVRRRRIRRISRAVG